MALQPVIRRSVPEAVFDQIATDVLSGELPAGSALPSERRLAEVFGVSRPAVREALKRLSAASLVEVRQGGVTTVRDFRRHAGLDLLPQLVFRDGELDAGVFRSILETRLRIGPKVAELAAEQHGPELAALLDDSLRRLEASRSAVEWHRGTLEFWDHMVDSSGSIVFRLMYNPFRAAYERAVGVLAAAIPAEINRTDAYRALAQAICAGDADEAGRGAREVLELANATMIGALERR
ncbi:FadR/GntR family transcriptional regulator [Mycobacterium avium]|uniref:HTH gntR-type domain-containing protein n=1 Tax=Mycolicibacterium paratuberculosis (strain ATCC BAA-968 / K-10) TaxID=262316 RepID=Q73SJ2_MYCPA|nr:FadR/GntR family transcriptional regulator [Mycobacterium avium]ELP44251.1 GntR family transcriptional regulator [Mycobacterium avium subsp. paratuberculosis S5]ETA95523.1 GntR family transcriptional regulator [Mycobacterium avium subsp. paratuberculosis 10-4404]ETA97849.1 GntR family transcriptional regulator [Mycobacterium avium subsp. paratuberculosis 10-5864]ETB08634.1 GntR family transcriptional regulator [Mycobacterium avium subsp. paratuberculosis 08-8281]ETB26030.1 GntR family trans